mmetsp:Transcript_112117/g.205765  ORF Transcript_112117/g.205765 Transcript_112117/m.205765 type:complete len:677 (+) Transcript_112117:71-2101(+)
MKTNDCCILFCALFSLSSGLHAEVTPVQKVVQLMKGMLEKGTSDMKAEQVMFAEYKQFCVDTHKAKQEAIADGAAAIEATQATIEKTTASTAKLGRQIAALDGDIGVWKGDEVAAKKVRAIEKAAYDALHKDYSESVDALMRAIEVLKKQSYDRKQKGSLVQITNLQKMSLIPKEAKHAIDQFLAVGQEPEGLEVTAPEANAYEFQSSSIIDMLNKLLDKFIDKRTETEKTEKNAISAYEVLMQDLANEISFATKTRTDKASEKAAKLQAKADAEGDLDGATATLAADTKYKSDLVATCELKAGAFESRQTLRAEELEAIQKAIAIIKTETVSGAGEKYLPTMLQQKKTGSALSQLRAGKHSDKVQEQAARYLAAQSKELNSRVLSMLAARVTRDPLGKVKKMIKDLIVKLMEEATAEVEHKGWCDTELATNEQTRQEKTESVETLTAEIDQLEASIAKLTEDITDLTESVAHLDESMAEATKLRAEEKAKNTKTISDAKEAQVAVAQALTVLNEFYAKAAEATAFVQGRTHQEPPPIWDAPYKGMGGESGGVVSMLEVINSDFARLEADTDAAETSALKEYDQFMEDSKTDKAAQTTDLANKSEKKQDEEGTLVAKKKDLEGTQKELTASLAYFDKLKPTCIDAGVSFKDRTERRREEIESLQEALKILNGEDLR